MKKVLWLIVCLMTMVVNFTSCGKSPKDYNDSEYYEEARVKAEAVKDSIIETTLPINSWELNSEVDEMSSTKKYFARIMSNNTIEQDFPYGETRACILVRNTKKYGNEALIMVDSGQIFASGFDNSNYIEVRFDENKSKIYYYSEAESGSSEVIFINRASDFIANCKKAKNIKIKLPLFQQGRELFTFHSDKILTWNH